MHEADELCNRVAIIDKGRILACDAPATLKHNLQREAIFRLRIADLSDARAAIEGQAGVSRFSQTTLDDCVEVDAILSNDGALTQVLASVQASGGRLLSLEKREATLEDVFLHVVGHGFEDEVRDGGAA
jgi:ABC-2 type transport system ATP-binding protein